MSQGITDKERWIGNVNVDNSQVQFLLTILKVLSRNLKKVDCLGASSGEIGKKTTTGLKRYLTFSAIVCYLILSNSPYLSEFNVHHLYSNRKCNFFLSVWSLNLVIYQRIFKLL